MQAVSVAVAPYGLAPRTGRRWSRLTRAARVEIRKGPRRLDSRVGTQRQWLQVEQASARLVRVRVRVRVRLRVRVRVRVEQAGARLG